MCVLAVLEVEELVLESVELVVIVLEELVWLVLEDEIVLDAVLLELVELLVLVLDVLVLELLVLDVLELVVLVLLVVVVELAGTNAGGYTWRFTLRTCLRCRLLDKDIQPTRRRGPVAARGAPHNEHAIHPVIGHTVDLLCTRATKPGKAVGAWKKTLEDSPLEERIASCRLGAHNYPWCPHAFRRWSNCSASAPTKRGGAMSKRPAGAPGTPVAAIFSSRLL